MFYTPNFCCECGAKIERIDWKPWTSRRFCENCEQSFAKQEWLPRVLVCAGILGVIFGFGSYLSNPEKPLTVTTTQPIRLEANKNQNLQVLSNDNVQTAVSSREQTTSKGATETGQSNSSQTATALSVTKNRKLPLPPEARQSSVEARHDSTPSEVMYFCGARTKKGTPCSRRVRGGGRCWQHIGQPAILPPDKLIASQ